MDDNKEIQIPEKTLEDFKDVLTHISGTTSREELENALSQRDGKLYTEISYFTVEAKDDYYNIENTEHEDLLKYASDVSKDQDLRVAALSLSMSGFVGVETLWDKDEGQDRYECTCGKISILNLNEAYKNLDEAKEIIENEKITQIPIEYRDYEILDYNDLIYDYDKEADNPLYFYADGAPGVVNTPCEHQIEIISQVGNFYEKLGDLFRDGVPEGGISSAVLQERIERDRDITKLLEDKEKDIISHASSNEHVIVIDRRNEDVYQWSQDNKNYGGREMSLDDINSLSDKTKDFDVLINIYDNKENINGKLDVEIWCYNHMTSELDKGLREDNLLEDTLYRSEKSYIYNSEYEKGQTHISATICTKDIDKVIDKCFDVAFEHSRAEKEMDIDKDIDIKR